MLDRSYRMLSRMSVSVKNLRWQYQKSGVRLFASQVNVKTSSASTDYEVENFNALPYSKIPGPSMLRLILDNLPGGKYYNLPINDLLKEFQKEYGSVMKVPSMLGKPDIVFAFNPDDIQTVFRTEGHWPRRYGLEIIEHYRKKVRPELFEGYQGLLNSHGKEWGDFRSAVNPVMIKPKAAKLYIPIIDEIATDFIDRVRDIRDPISFQVPENFEDDLNRWALESIGVIAMDTRFGLISDKYDERATRFINAVKNFFVLLHELESKPSLWRLIATKDYKKMMETLDTLANLSGEYIDEAKKIMDSVPEGSKTDGHEQSIFEKLLKIHPMIAKVMAMDMIFAGVDTTSSALTGMLYLLAKNPDKQENLRNEIRSVLPEKDSKFTVEKMNRLPYLRACLKESLRIFPIVNGNTRFTSQDVVLGGYRVPKGKIVVMSATLLQWEEKHYPKPKDFIPERWVRGEVASPSCPASAKQAHPFTYIPFGFGPRMCIGRRFAEMEAEILAAKIVRNFHLKWDHPDLKFRASSINVPDGKLQFTFVDL